MKKIIALLGTLVCAFLFAFCFVQVNAEEEVTTTAEIEEVTTTEEETESVATISEQVQEETPAETDDNTTIDDVLGIELSEEQLAQISDFIASATNQQVADLTMTLYAEIGVVAIALIIVVIVVLYFGIKKVNASAETQAVVDGIANLVKKSKDASDEDNAKFKQELKNVVVQLINSKNSADAEATQKKAEEVDKNIDALIDKIDNM